MASFQVSILTPFLTWSLSCADVLLARMVNKDLTERLPFHNLCDQLIMDAINGYWHDFIQLVERRKSVREQIPQASATLAHIQQHQERVNIHLNIV